MKKRILTFILFLTVCLAKAQSPFVGIYSLQQKGADAMSSVKLAILPNQTYIVISFGSYEAGWWSECNGKIILEADSANNEKFYLFARQSKELKDTKLEFYNPECVWYALGKEMNTDLTLNRLDSCDRSSTVVNTPFSFKPSTYTIVQVVMEDRWSDDDFSKLYTFELDKRYNDFKVYYNKKSSKHLSPIVGYFKNGNLYIDRANYGEKYSLTKIRQEDQDLLNKISSQVGITVSRMPFYVDVKDGEPIREDYFMIPPKRIENKKLDFGYIPDTVESEAVQEDF